MFRFSETDYATQLDEVFRSADSQDRYAVGRKDSRGGSKDFHGTFCFESPDVNEVASFQGIGWPKTSDNDAPAVQLFPFNCFFKDALSGISHGAHRKRGRA